MLEIKKDFNIDDLPRRQIIDDLNQLKESEGFKIFTANLLEYAEEIANSIMAGTKEDNKAIYSERDLQIERYRHYIELTESVDVLLDVYSKPAKEKNYDAY